MALRLIGESLFYQCNNHLDHLIDMLRRTRFYVRRQYTECRHVVVVGCNKTFGYFVDRFAGIDRRLVDLVINVGNVSCKRELVSAPQ